MLKNNLSQNIIIFLGFYSFLYPETFFSNVLICLLHLKIMGIFDLFKKKQENTQNKKESKTTEIVFGDLTNFISTSYDKKIKELDIIIKDLISKYNDELNKLESNINKLSNAEIKNKNLQERIIQIAHGNRENYIKNLNSFIKDNKISQNLDIIEFCTKFD